MKVIALTVAAAAGLATASPYLATGVTAESFGTAGSPTQTMAIDVSGFEFRDEQFNPINQILSVFVGVGAEITGIGWDVNLTSVGASWSSEAVMDFEGQVFLTVSGDDAPVTNMNYSSGGIFDLDDAAIPPIVLSADGVLDIEFFESFVDNAGSADNILEAGSTITIAYKIPAPGALAMLGMGGLVAGRRRR